MLRLPSPLGVSVCVCARETMYHYTYRQGILRRINKQLKWMDITISLPIVMWLDTDFAEVGGHRCPARMREKEFGRVLISRVTTGTTYIYIVITNDSDFNWPHLQMCGMFVFGKSCPKRPLIKIPIGKEDQTISNDVRVEIWHVLVWMVRRIIGIVLWQGFREFYSLPPTVCRDQNW